MPLIGIPHRFVFGLAERRTLSGFPSGRVRVVLSPKDFARAVVRTEEGFRRFLIVEKDGAWLPGPEVLRIIVAPPPP